jgi:hypothetical protein
VVAASENIFHLAGRARVAALVARARQRLSLRRPSLVLAAIWLVFSLGAGVPTAGVSSSGSGAAVDPSGARDRAARTGLTAGKSVADGANAVARSRRVHRRRLVHRRPSVPRVVRAVPREHGQRLPRR